MNTINDINQYNEVIKALQTMEMTDEEQNCLFAIVASVLHLGNIGFTEENGLAKILHFNSINTICTVSM